MFRWPVKENLGPGQGGGGAEGWVVGGWGGIHFSSRPKSAFMFSKYNRKTQNIRPLNISWLAAAAAAAWGLIKNTSCVILRSAPSNPTPSSPNLSGAQWDVSQAGGWRVRGSGGGGLLSPPGLLAMSLWVEGIAPQVQTCHISM